MDSAYPSRWRLGEGVVAAVEQDLFGPPGVAMPRLAEQSTARSATPSAVAHQLFACESLQQLSPRTSEEVEGEPFSLQWFLEIENQRHGRHARWIPRLLEFSKHPGETLLGLGHGLGTDWLQYARHGASVIVCSSCNAQLGLVRRHFQLRGLDGRFLHAQPTHLPLDNASIDVACISGLLQIMPRPEDVVREVFRVLKPGGKVIAVTPAKYDVDFWKRILFFWQRWYPYRPAPSGSDAVHFSARRLKRLFGSFIEQRVHKRQLRRAEVPHLWRLVPRPLLERWIGRILIIKAFKPVSGAIALQAAA